MQDDSDNSPSSGPSLRQQTVRQETRSLLRDYRAKRMAARQGHSLDGKPAEEPEQAGRAANRVVRKKRTGTDGARAAERLKRRQAVQALLQEYAARRVKERDAASGVPQSEEMAGAEPVREERVDIEPQTADAGAPESSHPSNDITGEGAASPSAAPVSDANPPADDSENTSSSSTPSQAPEQSEREAIRSRFAELMRRARLDGRIDLAQPHGGEDVPPAAMTEPDRQEAVATAPLPAVYDLPPVPAPVFDGSQAQPNSGDRDAGPADTEDLRQRLLDVLKRSPVRRQMEMPDEDMPPPEGCSLEPNPSQGVCAAEAESGPRPEDAVTVQNVFDALGPGLRLRLESIGIKTTQDLSRANPDDIRLRLGKASNLIDIDRLVARARSAFPAAAQ